MGVTTLGFQLHGKSLVLVYCKVSCAVLDSTQHYRNLLGPRLESEREHTTFQLFFLLQRKKGRGFILRQT